MPKRAQYFKNTVGCVSISMLLIIVGCMTNRDTNTRSMKMVEPRVSTGLISAEANDAGLAMMREALQQWNTDSIVAEYQEDQTANQNAELDVTAQPEAVILPAEEPPAANSTNTDPAAITPPSSTPKIYPANAGRMIALQKMSTNEIGELIDSLSIKLETEHSYAPATAKQLAILPAPPSGIQATRAIARVESATSVKVIRFGFRTYASQLPQLWVYGLHLNDNQLGINPDVESIQPQVDAVVAQIAQLRQAIPSGELSRKIIQLSYTDAANATKTLKALGINAHVNVDAIPAALNYDQLPLVAAMPSAKPEQTAIVGKNSSSGSNKYGATMIPTQAGDLHHDINAAPLSQLLVLYHPAHPEQYSRVENILDEYVDRPARQIFIEGMVLEISEDGLDELGIEWEFQNGHFDFTLGSLDVGGALQTLDGVFDDSADLSAQLNVTLQALVQDGKAEILSRPSVLTLNGRQAAIRVGEDIPIATSQEGTSGSSNKVSFNFYYIPVGILLNVRPRMNRDGTEISMLVDATVSATVPGRDLEIRSNDNELLASAPTIASRRVQTYGRIRDSTPYIIGGLVATTRTEIEEKVPLLGDLPLIGAAFRTSKVTDRRREVIIVLTPYVLPEDSWITRSLPKGDDFFDSTKMELFRDAYRIRAEDVFDLRFLIENKRLKAYRELADNIVSQNFELANQSPFSQYANGRIPGEKTLIHRMIYELIKRTKVDTKLDPERIIYLEEEQVEGYHVQFLSRLLASLGNNSNDMNSFFERDTGKAVAITYNYDRESMDIEKLGSEPLPEISLVDCADRGEWKQLLWDLNQPTESGRHRFTIVLHDRKDIERLQRAIMLKRILNMNGGEEALNFKTFRLGKLLMMPETKPDQVTVIDADVARYFYHTELYYAAALQEIEASMKAMDAALRMPQYQMYLENVELPPSELDN